MAGTPNGNDSDDELVHEGHVKNEDGLYIKACRNIIYGAWTKVVNTILSCSEIDENASDRLIGTQIPDIRDVDGSTEISLDFETANSSRASPCSIGIAWIRNTEIIRTAHRLIRPRNMHFDDFNIKLHGIGPEMVLEKPEFPEIWEEILPHIQGKTILAHNAAFDMSVLRATLVEYGIVLPELYFLCTVKVAQKVWPKLRKYKLPFVASHLKIPLSHHNAASDAAVCAEIAIRAVRSTGASGVQDLHELLKITKGRMGPGCFEPCTSPPSAPKLPSAEFITKAKAMDDGPLRGKAVVFTGELRAMPRNEAVKLVQVVGGEWQKNVRRDTDYLVVGIEPGKTKLAKSASQMDRYGCPKLIDETEFLRMVGIVE